jgi:hypothetical protein
MQKGENSTWAIIYVSVASVLTMIFYNLLWVPVIKPDIASRFNLNVLELAIVFIFFFGLVVANSRIERMKDSEMKEKLKKIAIFFAVILAPFAMISLVDIVFIVLLQR